jgi:K+-sensing histidine kinase KdpD
VRLLVDDSGSGIPLEKRERMFSKFQESLDLLNQGTVRISLSSLGLYI